jgi:hypothetical protein
MGREVFAGAVQHDLRVKQHAQPHLPEHLALTELGAILENVRRWALNKFVPRHALTLDGGDARYRLMVPQLNLEGELDASFIPATLDAPLTVDGDLDVNGEVTVNSGSWGTGYRYSSGPFGIISSTTYFVVDYGTAMPLVSFRHDANDSGIFLGRGNTNNQAAFYFFYTDGATD